MEEKRLCESVKEQITDLFVGDKHFSIDQISDELLLLFKNREYHCVETIVKTIPDNILQNFIISGLLQSAEFDDKDFDEESILFFYKSVSYYSLKIQASWRLAWKYIDCLDLNSAMEIQSETLCFIREDCPILSDYYLHTVIYQYVQSKANDGLDLDYDAAISHFRELISNTKILDDIDLLISDFSSNYMFIFDCAYMILGTKEDDRFGLITPLSLLHSR